MGTLASSYVCCFVCLYAWFVTQSITVNETRRDKDLLNWYATDDIDVNVAHVIGAVNVSVGLLDDDVSSDRAKRSRSEDSTMVDLFDMTPSSVGTGGGGGSGSSQNVLGSWNSTSSEVINAMQALLEEAVAHDGGTAGGMPAHGVTSSPRIRSLGVSTPDAAVKTMAVGESMLTMLCKLYERLDGSKTATYRPPDTVVNASGSRAAPQQGLGAHASGANAQSSSTSQPTAPSTSAAGQSPTLSGQSRVGNGAWFVRKLLDKICLRCDNNREILQSLYVTASQASSERSKGKGSSMDER